MAQEDAMEIGTSYDSDVDTRAESADAYGYINDGEYAVVWGVDRVAGHKVEVRKWFCQAGLSDLVDAETVEIPNEYTPARIARTRAKKNPDEDLKEAMEYWE